MEEQAVQDHEKNLNALIHRCQEWNAKLNKEKIN